MQLEADDPAHVLPSLSLSFFLHWNLAVLSPVVSWSRSMEILTEILIGILLTAV